jgi:uncharacterized repeat protein (TIGR03803 family)
VRLWVAVVGMSLWLGAAQAATLTEVYDFCSQPKCADGSVPVLPTLAIDDAGNLYGMTANGGAHGAGVIFELAPDGTETVLYSLSGPDLEPQGFVVGSGALYVETYLGGTENKGEIYAALPDESGVWRTKTLHNFHTTAQSGGAGMVQASSGMLYGVERDQIFKFNPESRAFEIIRRTPSPGPVAAVFEIAGAVYVTERGPGEEGTVNKVEPDNAFQLIHRLNNAVPDTLVGTGTVDYLLASTGSTQAIYRIHQNREGIWRTFAMYDFGENVGASIVESRGTLYGTLLTVSNTTEAFRFDHDTLNIIYNCATSPCPSSPQHPGGAPQPQLPAWVADPLTGALYGYAQGQKRCGMLGRTILNCGAIWELIP